MFCGLHHTDQADHLAKNLHVVRYDGIHGIILGLQAVMALFLIETLHGGGVIYQGHNNLAVVSSRALLHDQLVAAVICFTLFDVPLFSSAFPKASRSSFRR